MNQTTPQTPPVRRASDNLCKVLAERYPAQFVEWLFGAHAEPLTVLKTELSREPVRADAAMLLESAAELFHIEFQAGRARKALCRCRLGCWTITWASSGGFPANAYGKR